jgi:hypothetical protein
MKEGYLRPDLGEGIEENGRVTGHHDLGTARRFGRIFGDDRQHARV